MIAVKDPASQPLGFSYIQVALLLGFFSFMTLFLCCSTPSHCLCCVTFLCDLDICFLVWTACHTDVHV